MYGEQHTFGEIEPQRRLGMIGDEEFAHRLDDFEDRRER